MMGRALLVIGALGTVAFVGTAVLGYLLVNVNDPGLPNHVLVGLGANLLLLFSHSWIMFYLIGTGKAIKQAVAEHALPAAYVEETKRFKAASYPWLMLAMGCAMATFILGGGAATGALGSWVHHVLFVLAVPVQVWTLWIEHRVLHDNERLMNGINARLAAPDRAEAAADA
jgi:hypothetical protein